MHKTWNKCLNRVAKGRKLSAMLHHGTNTTPTEVSLSGKINDVDIKGTLKAFSVLLPAIKEQLDTHTWIVGSSIGIMAGFGSTVGVSAGALVKVFSPRVCNMTAGFVASFGLIVCSLATNPLVLLIGLVFSGFLFIQTVVAIGIVPDYFDMYYEAAVGIYSSGTALAILIFPLVTQELLETFGWRGTSLLLSAVALHSVPCGALLRPETNIRLEPEAQPILEVNVSSNTNAIQNLVRKLDLHLLARVDFVTRVFIPAAINGYAFTGWLIYMVFFVISTGASLKAATVVVTCGGVGMMIIRIGVIFLHKVMTHKQLAYISNIIMAASFALMTLSSRLVYLNILSVLFGAAYGVFGAEVYISAKMNSKESEHVFAIAWLYLIEGWAAILSSFLTGYVYDMTGSFTISFILLAGVSLSGTLSFLSGDIFTKV